MHKITKEECQKRLCEKTLIEKDKALKIIQENEDLVFIKFGYNSKLMKNTIQFHCKKCGMTSELQLKFFIWW